MSKRDHIKPLHAGINPEDTCSAVGRSSENLLMPGSPSMQPGNAVENSGESAPVLGRLPFPFQLPSIELEHAVLKQQQEILEQIERRNRRREARSTEHNDIEPGGNLESTHVSCPPVEEVRFSRLLTPRERAFNIDDGIVRDQSFGLASMLDMSLRLTNQSSVGEVTDNEVIEEQRRIMQAFKDSNGEALVQSEALTAPMSEASTSDRQGFTNDQVEAAKGARSKRSNNDHLSLRSLQSYQDRTVLLSNGRRLRVKGTKHVYKSIAEGKAVLVQCSSCDIVSQVDPACQALYCPICHQLTPVSESITTASDSELARSIQHQEKGGRSPIVPQAKPRRG
jgi:hypothetical protein